MNVYAKDVYFLNIEERSFLGNDGKQIDYRRAFLMPDDGKPIEFGVVRDCDLSKITSMTRVNAVLNITITKDKPKIRIVSISPVRGA